MSGGAAMESECWCDDGECGDDGVSAKCDEWEVPYIGGSMGRKLWRGKRWEGEDASVHGPEHASRQSKWRRHVAAAVASRAAWGAGKAA